ncbi:hypothetical protein FKM82_023812, partial [Ascaphus truei]
EDKVAPHVYPLIASGSVGSPKVTFCCLVANYFPEPVKVMWNTTTGEVPSGMKTFPAARQNFSSYTLSSQVTVNSSDWETKTYQCTVVHSVTDSTIQKTIPKENPCTLHSLGVTLLQASCPEDDKSQQVELICQISNLTSQDAQVKWYVDEKETPLPQEVSTLGKSSDNSYTVNSKVRVSQAVWNSGAYYKCHAKDTKANKVAEDRIRRCSDSSNCLGINVFLVQPTVEDLFVHKSARITCLASNIPKTSGYEFKWAYPGANNTSSDSLEDPVLNQNGTYSVSSVLTVCIDDWNNGVKFTCKFTYTGLATPISKTISKET